MKRISSHPIHQSSYRRKLAPRPKDAYKMPLGSGRWIGYLKGEAGSESWCACWRDETGKERQRVVGSVAELTYEQALALVQKRIEDGLRGSVSDARYTVRHAVNDYIHWQETHSGPTAAAHAKATLTPYVLSHPIAEKRLHELRHRDLERWQEELATFRTPAQQKGVRAGRSVVRKANSCNRILRIFKAALNRAKARKIISTDEAWIDIEQHKVKDGQRDVYLDLGQRQRLLAAASPDLRTFLLALLHTGARPNEVQDLVAEDFDTKTGTLRFTTRKGRGVAQQRTTHLAPEGAAFFRSCAKSKLPKAPLIARTGQRWDRHEWQRDLKEAVSAANAAAKEDEQLPEKIVAYTMRHTTISEWLASGASIEKVAANCGTSIAMIEKHYHKFIRAEFVSKIASVQVV